MNHQKDNALFDIETFKALYQNFNNDILDKLPNIYSAHIVFKDPIHQLHNLESLNRYFAGFFTSDLDCRFVFTNQLISNEQAFFQWQMHYRHPSINSGETLLLNGGTIIKFHSHIYYHEDFYDMGAMLYQHIPVLGWVVKKINSRLVNKQ